MSPNELILLILTILMVGMEIFQLFFIPAATRNLVKRHIANLGPDILQHISRFVAGKLVEETLKNVNLVEVGEHIQRLLMQSAGGELAGDKKATKKLKGLIYTDLMQKERVGKFLMAFPSVKAHMEKHPDHAEAFVLHILPKLDAMRKRAAMEKKAVEAQALAESETIKSIENNPLMQIKNEVGAKLARSSLGTAPPSRDSSVDRLGK